MGLVKTIVCVFGTVAKSLFVNSFGGFFGIVLGLVIPIDIKPPKMASDAKTVCGIYRPIIFVAPIYGAVKSHILAQTVVENEVIFRFSWHTSSMVHVAKIASVDEIDILQKTPVIICKATLLLPFTKSKKKNILN